VHGVERIDRGRVRLAERGLAVETGVVDEDVELFPRPALGQLAAEFVREGGAAVADARPRPRFPPVMSAMRFMRSGYPPDGGWPGTRICRQNG
jgi:hypothetical protein